MKIKTLVKYWLSRNLYYKNKILYYTTKLLWSIFK